MERSSKGPKKDKSTRASPFHEGRCRDRALVQQSSVGLPGAIYFTRSWNKPPSVDATRMVPKMKDEDMKAILLELM